MTEIELARFRRQLRDVSEEAREVTKTLRTFAAQCEEVSRIMRDIRDRYHTLVVVSSNATGESSDFTPPQAEPSQGPELKVIEGGRPS